MSANANEAYRGWAKFLNPATLRSNLILASIFLSAYEMLRSSVVDRIRGFFTYDFKDGQPVVDEDYETECRGLDKSLLRASLLWLKQMLVIDDADVALIQQIREHRNELAHDLPKFLMTADAEINLQLLASIYDLVTKIDRWWIREVDMAANSDFDGREVTDEDITSGNMLGLQMILQIATGEDSTVLWEQFQKLYGDRRE